MNYLPGNYNPSNQNDAREALDTVYQISNYLKCDLDKSTIAILISLIENGVKADQVAAIVT